MILKRKEFSVKIDELVIIIGFLCLIFKVIRKYFENYFVCLLFIAFHEFAHMFIASIYGIKTKRLNVSISGFSIILDKRNIKGLKWLVIYLAGPLSNVLLALLFKNISMVYTINLVLAVINLVPIYPLDGYNVFCLLLNIIKLPVKVKNNIKKTVEFTVIILFIIIGVYQFIKFKKLSLILMTIYIILQRSNPRNNSTLTMYQEYYKNVTKFN